MHWGFNESGNYDGSIGKLGSLRFAGHLQLDPDGRSPGYLQHLMHVQSIESIAQSFGLSIRRGVPDILQYLSFGSTSCLALYGLFPSR